MTVTTNDQQVAANDERYVMSCSATIYLNEESLADGDRMQAVANLAVEFGAPLLREEIDRGRETLTFRVEGIGTPDASSLLHALSNLGVGATIVLDLDREGPKDPYLVIHYSGASDRTIKRIQNLIAWIDNNEPNALIGSVTDLPNARPEDGLQIAFTAEGERHE